jgi:hypothetical protein
VSVLGRSQSGHVLEFAHLAGLYRDQLRKLEWCVLVDGIKLCPCCLNHIVHDDSCELAAVLAINLQLPAGIDGEIKEVTSPVTDAQFAALVVIDEIIRERGELADSGQLGDRMNKTSSAALYMLSMLRRKGMITSNPQEVNTTRITEKGMAFLISRSK